MANEVMEKSHATLQHPTEALLNSLPVQPTTSSGLETFKDVFASTEETDLPTSQKVMNAMLYLVLVSAVVATVRIFWTSALELLRR